MPILICAKCGKFIRGDGVSIGGKNYHKECLECAYCGAKLTGSVVTYKDNLYHPECNPAFGKMVCAYCRKPIVDYYIRLRSKYYHKDCYHNHVEKKCSVCGQAISGTYSYDDWGNFAHLVHGTEKTKRCYSCGRIISGVATRIGVDIELCNVCATTSVTTLIQAEACRVKVLKMFKMFGIYGVPEDIPIELKKKELMGKYLGLFHYSVSSLGVFSNFHIDMTYGLADVHFQGVLAHEMLHSWLVLYGREVSDEECEGFCNLGQAYVYQKISSDFSKYLLKRMYENEDRIYGDGYRLQKERFEKLGWAGLLESLRKK